MALSSKVKLGILAVVVLLLGVMLMSSYNGLVSSRQAVDTQANQVGVSYQRKIDLLPNITQLAEGVLKNETAFKEAVTAMRAKCDTAAQTGATVEQKYDCNQAYDGTVGLMVTFSTENYPQLQSMDLFKTVQTEMINSQNKIAAEQVLYNDQVGAYNTKIQKFPANIVAGLFGFEAKPYIGAATKEGASGATVGQNNI